MGTLDDKVAIVTGAGQGVGQGIALALASDGAAVAVLGRTTAKLEATRALIRERGAEAEAFGCDVADTGSIPGLVRAGHRTRGAGARPARHALPHRRHRAARRRSGELRLTVPRPPPTTPPHSPRCAAGERSTTR
ncbi:SDR family NAD(P)-dependent oxidoreductase [Actinomadura macra]|uniref:SDR family NAD(P)-dependent oxidoreductase n=1 Tax=Actinomadura macra TaxID=46164 RepID=UPI000A014568|nr:SDR family NAD(P)-dependent oxidoreductase [Actinomadura macra]